MELSDLLQVMGGVVLGVDNWFHVALARLMTPSTDIVAEVAGAVCAVLGSWLVASKRQIGKYGWLVWLVSNAFLIGFAIVTIRPVMLLMYMFLTGSSALGVWNHIVVERYPELARRFSRRSQEKSA